MLFFRETSIQVKKFRFSFSLRDLWIHYSHGSRRYRLWDYWTFLLTSAIYRNDKARMLYKIFFVSTAFWILLTTVKTRLVDHGSIMIWTLSYVILTCLRIETLRYYFYVNYFFKIFFWYCINTCYMDSPDKKKWHFESI